MKKNTKLILEVDEDELSLYKKQYINLADIGEEITKLEYEEEHSLDKTDKKAYKEWKKKINFLIDLYNTRSKYKTYSKVK